MQGKRVHHHPGFMTFEFFPYRYKCVANKGKELVRRAALLLEVHDRGQQKSECVFLRLMANLLISKFGFYHVFPFFHLTVGENERYVPLPIVTVNNAPFKDMYSFFCNKHCLTKWRSLRI